MTASTAMARKPSRPGTYRWRELIGFGTIPPVARHASPDQRDWYAAGKRELPAAISRAGIAAGKLFPNRGRDDQLTIWPLLRPFIGNALASAFAMASARIWQPTR